MALKLLIGFGFRWRRKVLVKGLERGREQVRKKEKRERRERPVKERRNKKEESSETKKTREKVSCPTPVCMILSSLGGPKALLVPQGFVFPQIALRKRPYT